MRITLRSLFTMFGLLVPINCVSGSFESGGTSSVGSMTNYASVGTSFAMGSTVVGAIEGLFPATVFLDPDGDSDGNGLPDSWELEFLGNTGENAQQDSDGDGTPDLLEFLAGTSPINAGSSFRPSLTDAGENEADMMSLNIPTLSGRIYRVWGKSALGSSSEPWVKHDEIFGDGSLVEWVFNPAQYPPNQFFRIEILINPQPSP